MEKRTPLSDQKGEYSREFMSNSDDDKDDQVENISNTSDDNAFDNSHIDESRNSTRPHNDSEHIKENQVKFQVRPSKIDKKPNLSMNNFASV